VIPSIRSLGRYADLPYYSTQPWDSRYIKVLLKQAGSAITKAVNDGDITAEDAGSLANLLEQSTNRLTPDGLTPSVAFLTTACAMFN